MSKKERKKKQKPCPASLTGSVTTPKQTSEIHIQSLQETGKELITIDMYKLEAERVRAK